MSKFTPLKPPPVPRVHFCDHAGCDAVYSRGFDVDGRTWRFCFGHRLDGEALMAQAARVASGDVVAPPKLVGRLL